MQNANNLNTNLNYLNAGEASALADINRRTTDANNAYNTGLAGANAQIEANYIQNLLNERDKALQRDLAERQFQESVRQFNENLALQRQQLYSRFNSGSGGGGSSRSSGRSNENNLPNVVSQNAINSVANAIASAGGGSSKASSSLAKTLNKQASAGNWSYKDTGKMTQRGIYANGQFYVKSGNKWITA